VSSTANPTESPVAPAPVEAPPTVPPTLTLDAALDFIHAEFQDANEPMLERVQRELSRRTVKALDGNETAAAKKLGLTKTALKKLLAE
jgi:DNA-binding NtrC family response regulator